MGLLVPKRGARSAAGLFVLALGGLALSPQASGDQSEPQFESSPVADVAPVVEAGPLSEAGIVSATPSSYAVPVPTPLPDAVTVASFENLSGVKSLDWLGPAAAFVTGELLTGHSKVRTSFGPLVIPRISQPVTTPDEIVAFAARSGADYVVTGSFSRPDWELELRLELWHVSKGSATRAGLAVNRGEFKLVHRFISKSLDSLFARVELPIEELDRGAVFREPTGDFYAFTLFGRGLSAFLVPRTAKEWKVARKNLERAVLIDPEFLEGQRLLGQFYRELARVRFARKIGGSSLNKRAAARFTRALEKRPSYTAASLALAEYALDRDQPERARDLFASVVKARPYDFEARFRLGKLLWDIGEAEESYAVLSELVAHRPRDIRARRILVMLHSARGSGEALVSELEEVAKLDPNDEQTRMDLGAAYASVERNQDAIDVYLEIYQSNQRSTAALKFLGDLHKKIGKREEAVRYYGLALTAAPSDPRPYFNLGALYVESGDDDKARRIYRRAQRFRRYAPEVHTNLGAIAFRAGKVADALAHHKKAVAASPRRARFRYNLALALSADGHLEDASSELAVGLHYDGKHVGLNYLKGVVMLRRGDVEAASIQFEKTLELEPEHEDALHNLELIGELQRRKDEGELIGERRL